jgi:hypothetical protein
MLHMIVLSHGPETCAAVHPHLGEMGRTAFDNLPDTGRKFGIDIKGSWVDPPGHVFYVLADAPNAHDVNRLMAEEKLFHWNTVDIHPIITTEEAASLAAG